MSKYRVKEQGKEFHVERYSFWRGWVPVFDFDGYRRIFISLEDAFSYIRRVSEPIPEKPAVYHYPNQDKWQTKPPSDVKPVVAPPPPQPPKAH